MRLAVLIISRERRIDLMRCLTSVVPQVGPRDEVHVLENGCSEASAASVADAFSGVIVHRSRENLGVPGGRNFVAARASTDVLVFIDDDAEAAPGLLEGLRRRFATDPELGVVALRVDNALTGRPRSHEFPDRRKQLADQVFHPTYFIGAGFAIRGHTFALVGGFDASLEYSLEELDMSLRLAMTGAQFLYDPELRVTHHARDVGTDRNLERAVANRWRVPVRHLPVLMAVSHVFLWTGLLFVRAFQQGRLNAWWAGVRDGARALPSTLRERRTLPAPVVARLWRQHGRLWF